MKPNHQILQSLTLLALLTLNLQLSTVFAQETVCPAGTTLSGVDVSTFNGSINWANAKAAGIVFAYAEATDGDTITDTQFGSNWSGMKAAGIVRGAMAIFEPNENATAQANYFLNVMGT
jgi:lysozyme